MTGKLSGCTDTLSAIPPAIACAGTKSPSTERRDLTRFISHLCVQYSGVGERESSPMTTGTGGDSPENCIAGLIVAPFSILIRLVSGKLTPSRST
jgi:hypothetical protein